MAIGTDLLPIAVEGGDGLDLGMQEPEDVVVDGGCDQGAVDPAGIHVQRLLGIPSTRRNLHLQGMLARLHDRFIEILGDLTQLHGRSF